MWWESSSMSTEYQLFFHIWANLSAIIYVFPGVSSCVPGVLCLNDVHVCFPPHADIVSFD